MTLRPLLSTATLALLLAHTFPTGTNAQGVLERYAHKLTPPQQYPCYPTTGPISIDGHLSEPDWQRCPHTTPFIDIEDNKRPLPKYRTTAQLLWDANYLYVAATIEEPNVVARLTRRDTIIWKENDFEVFLDPDGDGTEYYEFEINARNTVMDLLMTHPYRAGGDFIMPWDCTGLHHAVCVEGTLNHSTDTDRGWTVEMAIPIRTLRKNFAYTRGAEVGEVWRLNFSRVQWLDASPGGTESNWVWSPCGEVAMHMPERWGYLHFLTPNSPLPPSPFTPEYRLLWAVYYAQETARTRSGRFARTLEELDVTPQDLRTIAPKARLDMEATSSQFTLLLTLPDGQQLSLNERGHYRQS